LNTLPSHLNDSFVLQGISDAEEFVIHKTLNALKALTELAILPKPILNELLIEIVPLFVHPVGYMVLFAAFV
jgi:hypothetical protein